MVFVFTLLSSILFPTKKRASVTPAIGPIKPFKIFIIEFDNNKSPF